MFTGLITAYHPIHSLNLKKDTLRLGLLVPLLFIQRLKIGASIAVDGICLTVVKISLLKQSSIIYFDLINETLERSYLKQKKVGDDVNLERSLQVGDELGGHILSGHISDVATIQKIISSETTKTVILTIDQKWQSYLLPKTHIALDGISLTIGEVQHQPSHKMSISFSIHLIPETIKKTTFQFKKEKESINVEFNTFVKTIVETTKAHLSHHQQ